MNIKKRFRMSILNNVMLIERGMNITGRSNPILLQWVDFRLRARGIGNRGRRKNVDGSNIMLLFDLKRLLRMHLPMKSGNARMYTHLNTILIS